MERIIGFIGGGNMAQAILAGIISSNFEKSENIMVSSRTEKTINNLKDKFGVKITLNNKIIAELADVLVLAVKPDKYSEVIHSIKDSVKKDAIIVGIAAGKDIEFLEDGFGKDRKIVKAMPNTPARVGEGMTAISVNQNITKDEEDYISGLFNSLGKSYVVDESLMDVVTAVSGSSPAYVYMFIEAMADGAVLHGMPRKMAYEFAAQAVLGSAKMVLDTKDHPGKLKDDVCSPGGTTIEAVAKLEEIGLKSSVIQAMNACYDKSVSMNRK